MGQAQLAERERPRQASLPAAGRLGDGLRAWLEVDPLGQVDNAVNLRVVDWPRSTQRQRSEEVSSGTCSGGAGKRRPGTDGDKRDTAAGAPDLTGGETEATHNEAWGGIHGALVQRSKEQFQRYGKRDRMQRNEKEKGRPEVLSWGWRSPTRTRFGAGRQGTLLLLAGEGEHGWRDDVDGGQRG